MWATRPHLASIFEKLLDQKTFYLPAARIRSPFFLFPTYQKAVLYVIAQDGFLWSSILDGNRVCKKESFTNVRPDGYFHRHC